MFYHRQMADASPDVATALAFLRERWGGAAPVIGALARAPEPSLLPDEQSTERLADEAHVVRTGFPALDAILGPGGVPRQARLAMAGALLQARAVDLLLIDLPVGRGASGGPRKRNRPGISERLHRLTALARRAGTLLVVLEPPGLPSATAEALAEAAGLRLEL